ncbi:hypothetical protein [Burkholderia gladioli]|uniref:hypothetical protein n=1 Tax=Burkholderia gladioli TaxID=28095 RepID=UPI00202FA5F6|nr:hypothetical protein [Burkholderia gladioli]URV28246.1 hypothetical protein NAL90_18720 [Burkholderia gladioli]
MACAGESLRKTDHAGCARASGEHENEHEHEHEHDNEAALAWRLLGAHLAGLVFGVAILAAATVFVRGVLHVI